LGCDYLGDEIRIKGKGGATLSKEGFAALMEGARQKGVFVLSDEVYHNYIYEGEHVSALSFGSRGAGRARLMFACPSDHIDRCLDRIEENLK